MGMPDSEQHQGCLSALRWGKARKQVTERIVAHPTPTEEQRKYCGNKTTTTKYNLLTFIPKSLFEQYRRVANIYFTLVAALSLTPYSPVRPWTTFLPLAIVLGVAMVKEAVEDYKRHKQDVEVNNRAVEVFDPPSGHFVTKTWKDVRVGDIIIVHKNHYIPADLLFLSAENEEGICYIETMQLDGETNLKIKKALDETKDMQEATIGQFAGRVHCEPPNSRLYQFTGNLDLEPPLVRSTTKLALTPAAMLLRGCSLRNTHRIFGLVVYAGHDTKIFMNSTQPPSKRSSIERSVDYIIFFMFALLFSMCITGCIYFAWWTARYMPQHWYLGPDMVANAIEYDSSRPAIVGVTNFITSFILYGYLIPIALYVSIEMVKIVQSLVFIGQDRSMYHDETDTPAVARTSNLNEELGMVNTILSDKTGTLTRNVMEFFKCSIGGVAYGAGITEIERNNAERRGLKLDVADEEADNKYREQYFNFYDSRLMGVEWAKQPNLELTTEFFRLLALCHTVIPDGPPNPVEIRYEAESPDEAALVVAAKVFGFFMIKRTNTTITLRERMPDGSRDREYDVLNLLEFNSTRKRMSVIVKDRQTGRVVLYCKGADTVIYERLQHKHPLNGKLKEVTQQHMEDFGSAGLRTLCLAYTELDEDAYDKWNERYIEAKLSLEDRAAKLDAVAELVEKDLILLGCTAIEDKLQEGVPQTIKTLAEAGIRLWVLTGDKMETAINIGYACSLITDDMTQFQMQGACVEVDKLEAEGRFEEATRLSAERLESQLHKVKQTIEEDKVKGMETPYALIIDGKALLYALSPRLRQLFLEVGVQCAAVICCRVSPLQKAQVTALVKSWGYTTLAIGDGANDVGMIQKAHIGVGISGLEGMQAAMASDFTIAQFRFLAPLLLVHGRLSYKRITRMICFFFYKNLLYGSTIFVYNAFSLFSGQPIYNDFYMTLFNVVFTAAAPLVVGWFDGDLDKNMGLKYPFLYKEGQKNLYFSLPAIVGWLGTAFLHAALIVIMVLLGADSLDSDSSGGHPWSLLRNGLLMFTIVIITVHLQLAIVIDQWTWIHHLAIWGSIVLWFLFLLAFGAFPIRLSTDLHYSLGTVARYPQFWLQILLVPIACVLPVFFYRAMKRHFDPAPYQLLQELVMREQRGEAVDAEAALQAESGKPGGRSRMDLANRLKQRKERQRQGHTLYSGFVSPYNTQSRVFDANELRRAATQVGYSISPSGDMQVQPAHHPAPLGEHQPRQHSSSSVVNTIVNTLTRRHSSISAVGSTAGASMPSANGAASAGAAAAGLSAAGSQAAGGLSGAGGLAASTAAGAAVLLSASGVLAGDGCSTAGTSTPAAGSVVGGPHEAVPPVEGFVPNPVLANLERAFTADPRRHKRTDSQVSQISGISQISQPGQLELQPASQQPPPSQQASQQPSSQQSSHLNNLLHLCSLKVKRPGSAGSGRSSDASSRGSSKPVSRANSQQLEVEPGGGPSSSSSAQTLQQASQALHTYAGGGPGSAPSSPLRGQQQQQQPDSGPSGVGGGGSQQPSRLGRQAQQSSSPQRTQHQQQHQQQADAFNDDPAMMQLYQSALQRHKRGGSGSSPPRKS